MEHFKCVLLLCALLLSLVDFGEQQPQAKRQAKPPEPTQMLPFPVQGKTMAHRKRELKQPKGGAKSEWPGRVEELTFAQFTRLLQARRVEGGQIRAKRDPANQGPCEKSCHQRFKSFAYIECVKRECGYH